MVNAKGIKGVEQDDSRREGGFAGGNESGNGEDAGAESEVHQKVRLTVCEKERKIK